MSKRWSQAEISHLERHADDSTLEELAEKVHSDVTTVENKLDELGLLPGSRDHQMEDANLGRYEEALKHIHAHEWQKAAGVLEKLITDADYPHLVDRARQTLQITRPRLASDEIAETPYLQAVFDKNRGKLDKATEACLAEDGDLQDERWTYLLASLKALAGADDEALELLEKAIRLEPKNRVHAYHDPDFAELRGQEEFTQLIHGQQAAS